MLSKTVEKLLYIKPNDKEFVLLSSKDIRDQKPNYNFLCISYVQVATKPMHKKGLNNVILLRLTDIRFNKFSNIPTCLKETYPNTFVGLNVKLYGNNMKLNTIPILITYRI